MTRKGWSSSPDKGALPVTTVVSSGTGSYCRSEGYCCSHAQAFVLCPAALCSLSCSPLLFVLQPFVLCPAAFVLQSFVLYPVALCSLSCSPLFFVLQPLFFVLQLQTLIRCCCRRKRFLQGMTKMNGPVMLLALRDNVAAMEVGPLPLPV